MGKIDNSPLIEAIFELKWGMTKDQFEFKKDEADLFPGMFYQAVKEIGFDKNEQVNIEPGRPRFPLEVNHRFRKSQNGWPLFQIGLGIFTANQIGDISIEATKDEQYDWDTFKPTIISGLSALNNTYPNGINSLINPKVSLRYQDGFILSEGETIESFVNNKIQANINISSVFTDQKDIKKDSKEVNINLVYETTRPNGFITISVITALIKGEKGIIIDTAVSSNFESEHLSVNALEEWCEQAHDLQRHAFETLIEVKNL